MYNTYIIQSLKNKKYYIGHCENLEDRLKRHNTGKVKSTKYGKPWTLIYIEEFKTRGEAYRRELQIKSYKGGMAFKNLINKN